MSHFTRKIALATFVAILASGLAACQKRDEAGPGPAEIAGKKLDQAAEKAGEQLNKAAEKAGEGLAKAGEKLQGAAQDAEKKDNKSQ